MTENSSAPVSCPGPKKISNSPESDLLKPKTEASPSSRPDLTVEAVIHLLAEMWPKAFAVHEARRKPLKVGIHTEIMEALAEAITAAELSKALGCYTHNVGYLRSMKAGAERIGLDGKPAGAVDREQAWHAAVCWAEIARKKRQAKLDRGRKFLT